MNPKVSVCIVTYNQEKYIEKCLASALEQETDFDFEVVIGDDASTDGTRDIIRSFQERYPDKLQVVFHEKNIGPAANLYFTYNVAKGKYIAHLDGDDYMLPGKLKIQSDILDGDPSLSMCTHDLIQVDKESQLISSSFKKYPNGKKTLKDLYGTMPFFGHSSKMFRSDNRGPLSSFPRPDLVDIEIHVAQAKKGEIYHVDQPLGAYRTNVGVTTRQKKINPILPAATERVFTEALHEKIVCEKTLKKGYARSLMNYSYQSAIFGDTDGYQLYIRRSFLMAFISPLQLIMWLLSFTPSYAVKLCKIRAAERCSNPQ